MNAPLPTFTSKIKWSGFSASFFDKILDVINGIDDTVAVVGVTDQVTTAPRGVRVGIRRVRIGVGVEGDC